MAKRCYLGWRILLYEQRENLGMHPYKYMGRYGGKEGKNSDKVRIFFDEMPKMISLLDKMDWIWLAKCDYSELMEARSFWVVVDCSRVCVACAHSTAILIFCCHKCHNSVRKGKEKGTKGGQKKREKLHFSMLRWVNWEGEIELLFEKKIKYGRKWLKFRGLWRGVWHLWQQKW